MTTNAEGTVEVRPVPNNTNQPEPKVVAATTGGGVGWGLSLIILWLLDDYVITPDVTGDIPGPLEVGLPIVVGAIVALVAGYFARHQWRKAEVVSVRTPG